jgi:hypothetical protein
MSREIFTDCLWVTNSLVINQSQIAASLVNFLRGKHGNGSDQENPKGGSFIHSS